MTIEQLLDCSASELEAMTDEQLLGYFAHVLNITRPATGKIVRPASQTSQKSRDKAVFAEAAKNQAQLMKLFEAAGLKL